MSHQALEANSAAVLPPYSRLDEPYLQFNSDVATALDMHPLRGLTQYGPFSKSAMETFTPEIRIATVGPRSGQDRVRMLLGSLRNRHPSSDRAGYTPDFSGVASIFGVDIVPANTACHISWNDQLHQTDGGADPHERLISAFAAALQHLSGLRGEFDVVTFHLPDAWDPVTRSREFDAHDTLKIMAAQLGIPTQVLNDRVFIFNQPAQRSWRLSIALYVKAGGTPWKLASVPGVPDDTAYIGLGYAFRGDQRDAHFVTCCSQVFDTDGGGMQFVAYEARDPIAGDLAEARRNPYLSRDDMRSVLARTIAVYRARNGGSIARRVVLHKRTPFTGDEIHGARDALAAVQEVECIELTTATSWRGVWLQAPKPGARRGQPDGYPTPRGVLLPTSGNEAFIWAAGNAPGVSTHGNYYQGGKSIPRPLLLRRHAGAGALEIAGSEAMALTKMNWNNDALYDPTPVTIEYSSRIARIIARGPVVESREYPYRLFM